MRTDRGWRRFYATGWLVSAGITLVAFRMWQLHVREVSRAMTKLGARDRAQLVVFAYQTGLVHPRAPRQPPR